MGKSKSKGWLIGAVALAIACVFQVIGLIRYVGRLPDDSLGIGLYIVTIIAFGIAAIGFLIRWTREKRKEIPK